MWLIRKQSILIGGLVVTGLFLGYLSIFFLESNRVDIILDAEISAGNNLEIYTNNSWASPRFNRIAAGVRQRYVFEGLSGMLTSFRLDPSDKKDASIIIYGMDIVDSSGTSKHIVPSIISSWSRQNLSLDTTSLASVELTSLTSDPILSTTNIYSTLQGIAIKKIVTTVSVHWGQLFFLILLLYLVISYGVRKIIPIRFFLLPVFLFVLFYISKYLYIIGSQLARSLPAVYDTVGFASYTGYFKDADFHAFWITILGSAIFAVSCVFFWNYLRKKNAVSGQRIEHGKNDAKFSYIPFFTLLLFYAFTNFPYLLYYLEHSLSMIHAADYDSQNVITWQYFKYLGLIPMKDFWYPYSGFFYSSPPFFSELIFGWIHKILIFGISAFSIYRIFSYEKVRSLFIILAVWLLQVATVGTDRYFLSLSIVLFLAANIKIPRPAAFFVWGVYGGYVFIMEPVQLMYAAPAGLLLMLASFIVERRQDVRSRIIKGSLIGLGAAALVTAPYIQYLSSQGALNEVLAFYKTLNSLGVAGMSAIDIVDWVYQSISSISVYWWFTLLLFIFSLCSLFTRPKKLWQIEDFFPLAIALLNIMIFQKWLIRPFFNTQGLAIPIIGLLLIIARSDVRGFFRYSFMQYGAAVVAGVSLVVVFKIGNPVITLLREVTSRPLSIQKDFTVAFAGTDQWTSIKDQYFSLEKFHIDGMDGNAFKKKVLEKLSFKKNDDLFVLGDDAYVYIILNQRAPFHISFYAQSILNSQKNTVAWLAAHRPTYVLWNKSFEAFDTVPNIVRSPLIYEKVISDYTYFDTVGSFLIFQRNDREEAIDLDFWRENLGDSIDLGYIPGRSEPERFISEERDGSQVATFLTVMVDNPTHGNIQEIDTVIDGKTYTIIFREYKGKKIYHIHLNRVWFWQAAIKNKLTPEVRDDQKNMVRIDTFSISRDILY